MFLWERHEMAESSYLFEEESSQSEKSTGKRYRHGLNIVVNLLHNNNHIENRKLPPGLPTRRTYLHMVVGFQFSISVINSPSNLIDVCAGMIGQFILESILARRS